MKRVLAFVFAPLVLGALLYLALRAPDVRLFDWAHALGAPIVVWIRTITAPVRPYVPALVTGSLPDACWAFAFGSALALAWKRPSIWLWIGAGVTASLELAQAVHLIEGVFDWVDLGAMLAAYFIAWRTLLRLCCDDRRPIVSRKQRVHRGRHGPNDPHASPRLLDPDRGLPP